MKDFEAREQYQGLSVCVRLQRLSNGGACIGPIVEGPQELLQKKAFVRGTIPGEFVRARVVENAARFVVAELLEVLEASPQRRPAPCAVFGRCGGCDLQHMSIDAQREAKRSMLEETLRRYLKRPEICVKDCSSGLEEFRYRSRVSLHLDLAGRLGFYRRGSAEVVEFSECLLVFPALSALIYTLREPLRRHAASIETLVVEQGPKHPELLLRLREQAHPDLADLARVFEAVAPVLSISQNSERVYASARAQASATGHFSQVNPAANVLLQREVLARVKQARVLELYAGAGNFSLPLAQAGKQLVAVELDPELVSQGRSRAVAAKLDRQIEFVQSSCEQFMQDTKRETFPPSVLLDPPRNGAARVIEALARKAPKEIIYVSCNLATLTRDLQTLLAADYAIREVLMLDMFPQTHHVETLVELAR